MCFGAQVLDVDSDFFIVDPLHCLELNVAKTGYKYSFGDKMEDEGIRVKVSDYFAAIGVYFDNRAKGKRNPEQKWMSGADVDAFVMGPLRDPKSKSPGLAQNIINLIEIVFEGKVTVAPSPAHALALAPPTAAPQKRKAETSKRKRAAPTGGFNAGVVAASAPAPAPVPDALEELGELDDASGSQMDSLRQYLERRFGNFAPTVVSIVHLWEAYGKLFAAWRDEWTDASQEYRASRALRFLRAAVVFSAALNKVRAPPPPCARARARARPPVRPPTHASA